MPLYNPFHRYLQLGSWSSYSLQRYTLKFVRSKEDLAKGLVSLGCYFLSTY